MNRPEKYKWKETTQSVVGSTRLTAGGFDKLTAGWGLNKKKGDKEAGKVDWGQLTVF